MTAVKERGETAFEEAGEGVFLRFTNRDLKELQAKYGKTFLNEITDELLNNVIDVERLCDYYAIGAKKDGERFYSGPDDAKLDELPIAGEAEKLLDSLYVSIHGKSWREFMETAAAAFAEMEAKNSPPPN